MSRQVRSMQNQEKLLGDSLEATKTAVESAKQSAIEDRKLTKQSADAASENARIAKEALHLSERAYVQFAGILIGDTKSKFIGENVPTPFTIRLRNTGRTPARVTRSWVYVYIDDPENLPTKPEFLEADAVQTEIDMMAGDDWPIRNMLRPTDGADMVSIAGGWPFWIVGRIDYTDMFDNEHSTVFGVEFDIETILGPLYNWRKIQRSGFNYFD